MAVHRRRQRGDAPPKPAGPKPRSGGKPAGKKRAGKKAAGAPGAVTPPDRASGRPLGPPTVVSRDASREAPRKDADASREAPRKGADARTRGDLRKQGDPNARGDPRKQGDLSTRGDVRKQRDPTVRGAVRVRDASERPQRHGSEWLYGRQVAKLVLAPGSRRRAQAVAATAAALRALEAAADLGGLERRVVETEDLDELLGTREHQGIALRVPAFRYAELEDLFSASLLVVLDEVTDPHNVGAVARSALASGAGGLVLPARRSAAVTPAAVKASAGATEHLPVAQVINVAAALKELKARGFWVYGAAAEAELSFRDLDYAGNVVLVLGSEGTGLRPLVARTCDSLAAIPVAPPMDSLNVSVAAALFLYEARRHRDALRAARPRYPTHS